MLMILSGSIPGTEIRVVSKTVLTSLSSSGGRNGVPLCRAVGQSAVSPVTYCIQYTASAWLVNPGVGFEGTFKFLIRKWSDRIPCFPLWGRWVCVLSHHLFLGLLHAHRIALSISLVMFYDASLHRFERSISYPAAENPIFTSQVSLFVMGIDVSCCTSSF